MDCKLDNEYTLKTTCSVTCGGGVTSWKKVKTEEAQHGGKKCTGDEEVKKECNVDPCPGNSLTNKMPASKLIFLPSIRVFAV